MRQGRLTLLALAVAALLLAFVLGRRGDTPTTDRVNTAGNTPDEGYGFVAKDVVVQQSDASGLLQYELLAAQVARRDDAAPIVAHELSLQSQPLDAAGNVIPGRRWTLRANEGQLPGDSGELQLAGNVELHALLPDSPRPMTVHTDNLAYNIHEQILRTQAQVLFSWGEQKVQGTGLYANVRKGTLKLQSGFNGSIILP